MVSKLQNFPSQQERERHDQAQQEYSHQRHAQQLAAQHDALQQGFQLSPTAAQVPTSGFVPANAWRRMPGTAHRVHCGTAAFASFDDALLWRRQGKAAV